MSQITFPPGPRITGGSSRASRPREARAKSLGSSSASEPLTDSFADVVDAEAAFGAGGEVLGTRER